MDPGRQAGKDKSKPHAFIPTRAAMRLDGAKVYLNFQGLGEKEFTCSDVQGEISQCVEIDRWFVFECLGSSISRSYRGTLDTVQNPRYSDLELAGRLTDLFEPVQITGAER